MPSVKQNRNGVLFVQKRTGKSGAPVALYRLITQPEIKKLNPILLVSQSGWLSSECQKQGIPVIVEHFPSSRTLISRLWNNRQFSKKISYFCQTLGYRLGVVIGNDHMEGLLCEAISRRLSIPRILFLRSSEMAQRDFTKYHGDQFNLVYTVLDEMQRRVKNWNPAAPVKLLSDGINLSEIYSPKPKSELFPQRILVLGSESHYKGWQDFAAAVDRLEQIPDFPALEFDFTGRAPNSPFNDMQLEKQRRSKFNFIGRVDNFQALIRRYDLVIHPSREEAFGLAMIETLAAGVPLFCSRAGVIEKILDNPQMLFLPNNVDDLAQKLELLWRNWKLISPNVTLCQNNIRQRFLIGPIASEFSKDINDLIEKANRPH
jgi:glycosyltransferase involved in cell wall biosynthesis